MFFTLYNIFSKYTNYPNWHKITKNIYIGDAKSSLNSSFLKKENITIIVNCTPKLPFIKNNSIIKYRIPVKDDFSYGSIYLMTKYLKKYTPILNQHLENNENILIHCRCGIQRSAIVVASILMFHENLSKGEAMKYIQSIRNVKVLFK